MSRPSVDRCHPAVRTPTGPDTVDWDYTADREYTAELGCTAAPDCPSPEAQAADRQVAPAAPGTVAVLDTAAARAVPDTEAGLVVPDIAVGLAGLDIAVAPAGTGPVERVVLDFAAALVAQAALDIAAARVALDSVAPGSAAAAD